MGLGAGRRRGTPARPRSRLAEGSAQEAVARTTLGLVLGYLGDADAGEAQLRHVVELPESEHTPRAYVHLGELQRIRGDHAAAALTMDAGEAGAAR